MNKKTYVELVGDAIKGDKAREASMVKETLCMSLPETIGVHLASSGLTMGLLFGN